MIEAFKLHFWGLSAFTVDLGKSAQTLSNETFNLLTETSSGVFSKNNLGWWPLHPKNFLKRVRLQAQVLMETYRNLVTGKYSTPSDVPNFHPYYTHLTQ